MSEDGAAAQAGLVALLALQDADLHVDQLRHRRTTLPERVRLSSIEADIDQRGRALGAVEAERAGLDARASTIDEEVRTIRERRAAIDARLSSGNAGSFRDQEAMANELGALTDRMAALEDDELTLLEEMVPLEGAIAEAHAAIAGLEAEAVTARAALREAEADVDAAIAAAHEARADLVAPVPEALLVDYERLRAQLDGIGAARLERGACSGCHLVIPATELDQMRHAAPGTVFHCDQCGRILVAG